MPSGTTSLPMPSPGMTAIRYVFTEPRVPRRPRGFLARPQREAARWRATSQASLVTVSVSAMRGSSCPQIVRAAQHDGQGLRADVLQRHPPAVPSPRHRRGAAIELDRRAGDRGTDDLVDRVDRVRERNPSPRVRMIGSRRQVVEGEKNGAIH